MWAIIVSTTITLQTVETSCCLRESEFPVKTQNNEKQEHEQIYKYFRRTILPLQYDNHLTI